VSYEKLSSSLPDVLGLNRFRYARGLVLPTQDLYILFYDRTGLSGQFLDSYVTWNYRTGEFGKGTLGQQVIAAQMYKPVDDGLEVGLVSGNTKVWEFDSINNRQTDDGVEFVRYVTSGWQKMPEEEGWLLGVVAVLKKTASGRIKISVAKNFSQQFEFEQTFELRSLGAAEGTGTNQRVECNYRFPSPQYGEWFNVKVKFYHDNNSSLTELYRLGFIAKPTKKYPIDTQIVPRASNTRG
jgi:hypothetical protein